MKLSDAKKYLPFVQAAAEGKTIQISIRGRWEDCRDADFIYPPEDYRIKPEPKLRPWRIEEVPVGALIRFKGQSCRCLITAVYGRKIYDSTVSPFLGKSSYYPHEALMEMEHSLDSGKTWKPCGIKESQ